MKEAEIRQRLWELRQLLKASAPGDKDGPTQPLQGSYEADPAEGHPTTVDSLDQLRLQLKYLQFDLEATRRENRYLRQMLEIHRPGSEEPPEDRGPAH